MSTQAGVTQQDRTLSDQLETYRHYKADPSIPRERKRLAAERMKPVYGKIAKLQDPSGFTYHISEYIQREFQRRNHHAEDPDLTRRTKPLCRCTRSRHVCEVKNGEVPSKIRTQDLEYIHKEGTQELARQYVEEHSGDVVVREALDEYRTLRSEIYAEIEEILAMMSGEDLSDVEAGPADAPDGPSAERGGSDGDDSEPVSEPTAAEKQPQDGEGGEDGEQDGFDPVEMARELETDGDGE